MNEHISAHAAVVNGANVRKLSSVLNWFIVCLQRLSQLSEVCGCSTYLIQLLVKAAFFVDIYLYDSGITSHCNTVTSHYIYFTCLDMNS